MKFKVNEKLVKPIEVDRVEPVETDGDSSMRSWMAKIGVMTFAAVVLGGVVYAFVHQDASIYDAALAATLTFTSGVTGYFFGRSSKK